MLINPLRHSGTVPSILHTATLQTLSSSSTSLYSDVCGTQIDKLNKLILFKQVYTSHLLPLPVAAATPSSAPTSFYLFQTPNHFLLLLLPTTRLHIPGIHSTGCVAPEAKQTALPYRSTSTLRSANSSVNSVTNISALWAINISMWHQETKNSTCNKSDTL